MLEDPVRESSSPPTPAPAAAPPTVPSAIPKGAARPTSKIAVGSMVCGLVGFLVPLVNLTAVVLGVFGLRRIARSDPKQQGLAYAIIGICLGALSMVMQVFVVAVFTVLLGQGGMLAVPQMQEIRNGAVAYAGGAGNGAYPMHVAELVAQTGGPPVHLLVNEGFPPTSTAVDVTVGDYDFSGYTFAAQDNAAVLAAVKSIDTSAPYYRFGDRWFVRLPQPTGNGDIVFAWSAGMNQSRTMLFDDGQTLYVAKGRWDDIWEADAAARTTLGLPAIPMPPWTLAPAPEEGDDAVDVSFDEVNG